MRSTILLLCISMQTLAQVSPEKDTSTYAFPIGSKVLLEMIPIDSVNIKYHVVEYSPYLLSVDPMGDHDSVLPDSIPSGHILLVFTRGKDLEGPFATVLMIKVNTSYSMEYDLGITVDENLGFFNSSVTDLYPGAVSVELWPDPLIAILPHHFKRGAVHD